MPASEIAGGVASIRLDPLGPADAVRLAILQSNNVTAANLIEQRSELSVQIAAAKFYPEAYYSLSPASGGLFGASAGMRFTIYDFGARAARVDAAEDRSDAARHEMVVQVDEEIVAVMNAYLSLAAATAELMVTNDYIARLEDHREVIASQVAEGAVPPSDERSVDIALLEAQSTRMGLEGKFQALRSELQVAIGAAPARVLPLEEMELLITPLAGDVEVDLTPRVMARLADYRAAEATLRATRAETRPSLGVQASASTRVLSDGSATRPGVQIGPDLRGILSFGGANRREVEVAALDLRVAAEKLDAERKTVRAEIAGARIRESAMRQQRTAREKATEISLRLRELKGAEYEAGRVGISELMAAERQILDSQLAELDNRLQTLLQGVTLMVIQGELQRRLMVPSTHGR